MKRITDDPSKARHISLSQSQQAELANRLSWGKAQCHD